MTLVQSVILGFVEGITEFLPISSTAHLILTSQLLRLDQTSEFLKFFEVFIQSGAILAVVVLYFRFILKHKTYILNLFLSFLPTALIGFLLHDMVKSVFFESNMLIASSLLIGGILFIILEYFVKKEVLSLSKTLTTMTYSHAVLIGIFQALAIIPGVSRAGAVIVGMILLKYKRTDAALYSFLLAVPTILAAGAYDALKTDFSILSHGASFVYLMVGFLTAFISAYIVIKWLIRFLQQHTLLPFALYRIIIGALMLFA